MSLTASTTPVLLIVFNRPDKVEAMIAALAQIQPKFLYVAADGPRSHKPADAEKCAQVRQLLSTLPWECEIRTNFQPENLGCKRGVSTAITWFFTQVPAGIILEDDCIPTPSFFAYAAEMLTRYESNTQVMHINGSTFIDASATAAPAASYHISKIALVWGWATWRRAWAQYDIDMKSIPDLATTLARENTFGARRFRHFWVTLFRHLNEAKIDTWDGQWLYSILKAGGLCITPAHNLIHNIGFDADATHTTEAVAFARGYGELDFPLVHPTTVAVDTLADRHTMNTAFVNTKLKQLKFHLRSLFDL